MQGPTPIPVYRPSYLTDGLEFQGHLTESPANIFYQKVRASRATMSDEGSGRMQFQWRSVSDNLLMSPTVLLRFKLKITSPQVWTQLNAYIAADGIKSMTGNDPYGAGNGADPNVAGRTAPAICFADGDAFTSCCSSINLVFNGTSLSLNRTNRFWRDWMRTQVSAEDAARIYRCCGGAYDADDHVGVTVDAAAAGAARTPATVKAGLTIDSGIAERCKALYSQLTRQAENQAAAEGFQEGLQASRYIWVSYPVPVAPLNPWRGYALPATSPYNACPMAIPHFSAGGLDFLFEDFQKAFIRRIGMGGVPGAEVVANLGADTSGAGIKISLVPDSVELELKYFRLSHTRSLKESYRFNVWQAQTFLSREIAAADGQAFRAIGKDTNTAATLTRSFANANSFTSVKYDPINLAQVPSFLLISVPRKNSAYSHAALGVAARNPLKQKSANLSIRSLKIVVNAAQGHIDKSGDSTYFVDAERLWEMTRENATSHYFKKGGFRAWRDKECAILLSSAQFAPGLQVCDGVAYPVQIEVEMEVENRHVGVCPLGAVGKGFLVADVIEAQAQVTAIFTKVILATTETSATTNAMNFPLDSAERLLNQAGQMR